MKVIRAEHLGMCFGVRDAIALANREAKTQPLTILGDLVHNETVLTELRSRGIRFETDAAHLSTDVVMITAHGASDRSRTSLEGNGLRVLEATCPLVHYAHRSLRKLVEQKYHPIVIGKRDHVEVRGLTEDFAECDVILSPEDVAGLKEHSHFGVISQTTQPIEKVRHLVDLIRQRFPNSKVRFIDTVCQPTKQRQTAAVELARQCDVVIVIGGANSNNTRELVATCRKFCERVYHVQHVGELHSEWIERCETVGITAGTSTPDAIIDAVEKRINELVVQFQMERSVR
jgi:4-hydroxy-3-methylbut-2-enyl diphosphate reductase